ncbi:M15 family metallopeptidase [Streptomonospora sp. S1-112]|uniref:M15 family metallopeptidase n=1 Tax=Streptomonospora mangrovi TaxID=2883123 RepID=A0A9X3NPY9_9ACTN|nr:M15 family metallopeptidase [Streptomonospora mangrovi]MDA0567347.1 M15 family metallopeptidase [Streptomonospora mangrovi]
MNPVPPAAARPGRARRAAALGLCLAAVLSAAAHAHPPAGATEARGASGRPESSAAELTSRLAAVRARLDDLQADADAAVLDYAEAADRLAEARSDSESARRAADRAAGRGEDARDDAARYAAAAYKGAELGPAAAWSTARGPQEVLDRSAYLAVVGGRRADTVATAGAASTVAQTLAERAEEAEEERADAAEEAREARDAALEAVAGQRDALAGVIAEQTDLELRLARAGGTAGQPEETRAAALERASAAASAGAGPASSAAAGEPCTASGAADHPNGRIPESALCPLPQPGEMLRADAAAAFIRLDGEFRERFGRPMCVTDSYRPYAEQVRLFHEKEAGMAADPGTSTHGRGIAVDLCGGVEEHGSPEHAWMLRTAPQHGWHNPEWARGGFEPWHWEYTG